MEQRMDRRNLWGIEQFISKRILLFLMTEQKVDRIQFLKCKLDIESFVNNGFKLLIVYFVAFILNVEKSTFLLHVGFLVIRTFAYGTHTKSSSGCIIVSLIQFVGMPFVLGFTYLLPKFFLLILSLFSFIVLINYAPGATVKNKIKGEQKRKKLRRKALLCCAIISLVSLFIPLLAANLIVIGNLLATCCVLPIFNKKGEVK